ncbi:MAG TPA: hypothetical protein VK148_15505 [Xanthobacteraceae bacterium]|jgi:hypothetical protein|nr:hypothetical protein [Xanthobacteraceae bacterium]
MIHRSSIGAAVVAAALGVCVAANAQEKKFPDWDGLWGRGSPVGLWDPSKPPGPRQEAPLTPEYQAIYQSNLAKGRAGTFFDIKGICGPVGMPRVMIAYEPIEIILKPKTVYMLAESMSPLRRIYTDAREFPKEEADALRNFSGYSVGKWSDTDNDGTYDTLEVETRYMQGPRLFDSTGIPLHKDNQTVVKEKLYLDKADRNILRNEITTIDNALTKPWTVNRFYRRVVNNPIYEEYNCTEDNRWITIGDKLYLLDGEGYVMPIQKDQPPPDPKYLQKYFKQPAH